MKRVHFIANKFGNVRRDIIKNKGPTDIEVAHERQAQNANENANTTAEGVIHMTS